MPERPESNAIGSHGLIGNMGTAALVGLDGTIDFLCWPRFDAPSVFASILDAGAGHFAFAPRGGEVDGDDVRRQQIYLPDTNILITRFLSGGAVAEIADWMPVRSSGGNSGDRPGNRSREGSMIVRVARCIRGTATFDLACAPRFDYGRVRGETEAFEDGVAFSQGDTRLRLFADHELKADGGDATASFTLEADKTATFVLCDGETDPRAEYDTLDAFGRASFDATSAYWRGWIARSTYRGLAREAVERSALALKLLTDAEHGSIVAAPTFGLPEQIGGARNWDYRYAWIRDTAFTIYAFVRLGFTDEADAFMTWAHARMEECGDGTVQIMYGLDGRTDLPESELDHLEGHRGSAPVRIGNAAHDQLQLDSYGALMDAVYLANKYGEAISYDGWLAVCRTVDWVCENWGLEDEGIWEFRGGRRHFLSSRLMCWVTVDRALRMAQKASLPGPVARWQEVRNTIHHSIHEDFWDEDMAAFVQAKGSSAMDASCLLMPLVKFIGPTDPKWLSTLDAVGEHLANDALVKRYDTDASADIDGLDGEEGSFTVCSFWYVECLARAGRLDEARLLFGKLLSYANHLGLYAEELGPAGEHLGNFPQGLTHLSLISAATALDRANGERS